jgi:hypothetical protein
LAFACFFLVTLSGCEKKPQDTALTAACANNLRMLDQIKSNWAQKNGKGSNDVPTWDDLAPYFFKDRVPKCPTGGTYTLGPVGQPTQCSIADHNEYYKQHPNPGE